ncbi:P-loop ATPase, Sll1717 family [Psychrobacter sp. 230]|uniref:P-loop ATPase, Sll1717 family n=1 Tax=Psychrobacter sp. 230 TaxID=2555884 RepID=UPI00106882D2|nr:hypothetical protein [Psychrobacter sp. 230]TEW86797.1 hypothetical protein E2545_07075 [Psychrobacter sp. 230]
MSDKRREAFKEVASWRIDANLENNERYFYKTFEVDMLLRGDKSYVIGRKGTGKTAIANFLKSQKSYDYFASNLSLKNFPFNTLYSLKDESYTNPNEYITIWKYIIYIDILYLMQENQSINEKVKKDIKTILPKKPIKGLSRRIKEITSKEFKFDIKALSFCYGISDIKDELNWIEKVEFLEELIFENIDNSNYFIIFDELDEDYKHQSVLEPDSQYLNLIAGLFKAIQHIKSLSFDYNLKINPVIFLRDDIYDLIQDHDKNKWSDLSISLKWTKYTIQSLIAYRLSRAKHPRSDIESFGRVWNYFFSGEPISYGGNRDKTMTMYDWITKETLHRPRDYIKYIQLCAKKIYESNYSRIFPATVTTQDITYSSYFRNELVDEIHSIIPDINRVLEIFSKIGKAHLNINEFTTLYDSHYSEGLLSNKDSNFILQVLFNFSVIGNHNNETNKLVFRYINREANLNFNHAITIHRGLYKSLQLY